MNRFQPHVYILPEDRANEQLAIGFLLAPSVNERAIQVLRPAGGWMNVLTVFKNNLLNELSANRNRHIVLLIDFDRDDERMARVKEVIPDSLAERVFVLGVLSEPEDLRKAKLGTFEDIGKRLARECGENTTTVWNHELLQHNAPELKRMMPILKPILFPNA